METNSNSGPERIEALSVDAARQLERELLERSQPLSGAELTRLTNALEVQRDAWTADVEAQGGDPSDIPGMNFLMGKLFVAQALATQHRTHGAFNDL